MERHITHIIKNLKSDEVNDILKVDVIENCKEDLYNKVISKFRSIFAQISVEKLNPDFVIMDEFQRFKYILNSDTQKETEIGMLANKFFKTMNLRMLLLSATPYKMYSTLEEIDESDNEKGDHYTEFMDVMKFLNNEMETTANDSNNNGLTSSEIKFEDVWNNYSIKLKEMAEGYVTVVSAVKQLSEEKNKAENAMYKSVCRTERISEKHNSDIIDSSGADIHMPIKVIKEDIESYLQAQKLIEEIGCSYRVPVDYVKSSPYLLSFMRDYKLKRDIEKYFKDHKDELNKLNKSSLWLDPNRLEKFEEIPHNNARLDHVMDIVMKCGSNRNGAEKLLWIPPSRPYYEMQGVFKESAFSSKTLIFSSWEMVPRMLASLISYEVEIKTIKELAIINNIRKVKYFHNQDDKQEKRYPAAKFNFSLKKDEPVRMSLFCLLYPSEFLANCYNPINCMNDRLKLPVIRSDIKKTITRNLKKLPNIENARPDKRWYWFAPLMLDKHEYVEEWLAQKHKIIIYNDFDSENSDSKKQNKGFNAHLDKLEEYFDIFDNIDEKSLTLGRQPDDLADVLTDMSIASPAVCILRTYRNYIEKTGDIVPSELPSQFAKVFIDRMNTPESTAAVMISCPKNQNNNESLINSDDLDEPHWRNVLSYCLDGNIQAVLDEYAHILSNGLDHDKNLLSNLHKQIVDSMKFRTTTYSADTLDSFSNRVKSNSYKKEQTESDKQISTTGINIRSHYASAFTQGDGKETDKERKKTLRNAFNSPFRPFVLATTSVGQEGLDFHNYCRRIIHWNLPSNPIDLEQREGRINRFECLAIRQNVAKRYGNIKFDEYIWNEMFAAASRQEKGNGSSDLIPYWGLSKTEDMVKIERIVPMYPFSRDISSYERLIKILSLYRLTLGQARQEELLEYIFKNCDKPDELKELFINLSPFYKKEQNEASIEQHS